MVENQNMDVHELKKLVSDNKPFGVSFTKKDGSTRVMIAQTGVKPQDVYENYESFGDKSFKPDDHNLLCVLDVEKQEYRHINVGTIQALIVNGVKYINSNGSLSKVSV